MSWAQHWWKLATGQRKAGKSLDKAIMARAVAAIREGFPDSSTHAPEGDSNVSQKELFSQQKKFVQAHVASRVELALHTLAATGERGLAKTLGWRLEPAPSAIGADTGNGLFLRAETESDSGAAAHVVAGDVLSIYPGIVFSVAEKHNQDLWSNNPGFEYLLCRSDYKAISATPWAQAPDGETALGIRLHSFSKAHLIQHPPGSVMANCCFIDYDYPSQIPQEWLPWIPNLLSCDLEYGDADADKQVGSRDELRGCRPPSTGFLPGTVIIALDTIYDGQELFMDYRYPAPTAPIWWEEPQDWLQHNR